MPTNVKNIHPYVWISMIGLLVWGWTLTFGFVWDDYPMIVTNPSLFKWSTLLSAWTHDFWMLHESPHLSGYWRPVVTVFHTLIVQMFGKNAWAFHLFNVVLHISVACCFYQFLNQLQIVRWIWIPVVFFLVHPLQSETVSFVSASPDLFCALFGWSALSMWTRPTVTSPKKIAITLLFLSLCTLCKESGIFFGVFFSRNRFMFAKFSGPHIGR